jgi:hypothetical protein
MAKSITLSTAISIAVNPRKPRPRKDFIPVEFVQDVKVTKRQMLANGDHLSRDRKSLVATQNLTNVQGQRVYCLV